MGPDVIVLDLSNRADAHTEVPGDNGPGALVGNDRKNYGVGEFRVLVGRPTLMVAPQVSAALDLIVRVILSRSQSKMLNGATRRVVTGMKDTKIIWDRTMAKLPCNSMGQSRLFSAELDATVALMGPVGSPFSTPVAISGS